MVSQKNFRSIIAAALVFIVTALCFYWLERDYRWNSRADYSGNGIYDLSKFKPYELEFLCMAYGRIPPISIYQLCCHRCGGGIADSWKGKEKMAGWDMKIRFSA